jgi:hypothetical protein
MSCKSESPCPVCANTVGNLELDRRARIPTLQNVALKDQQQAIQFPTGALKMIWCAKCSFVWNADFDPDKIVYNEGYNNDVTYSGYYVSHLEAMADRVIASVPVDQPIHYVEIGCGEGDFLKLVVERSKGRCLSATGFDPSFANSAKLPTNATIRRTFFGADQLALIPKEANVICSRHTIEHVPDVQSFVQALASPITNASRKLFIETPDVNWILEHTAFQDFFYEHCSIYTPTSIALALRDQGLHAKTTPVYGGQYMWTEAWRATNKPTAHTQINSDLATRYKDNSRNILRDWGAFIYEQSKEGPVAVWGAASKGVTFSLLMSEAKDTTAKIACAIDLNEAKQGCFLPLSGASVVTPQQAMDMGVQSVIIMNPNYHDEIFQMAKDMNWTPKFVTLNN